MLRKKQETHGSSDADMPVRERIMYAAYRAFTEKGYAGASTLEIATRAKVSKRELYAHFANKQAMLVACIASRTIRMRLPADLPAAHDRDALARALSSFGAILIDEISQPEVIAVYRLAIAEAVRAPEVAQALDSEARRATRAALAEILAQAQAAGLIGAGNPLASAEQFMALLWGDLLINLLLGVATPPGPAEIEARALKAAAAFLTLHPKPQA
ncbi:MAG: TetR/AcrR family transcriptional regulator [Methylomonas sp.]|jgi:AcrR family transcriptional regulator